MFYILLLSPPLSPPLSLSLSLSPCPSPPVLHSPKPYIGSLLWGPGSAFFNPSVQHELKMRANIDVKKSLKS